MTVQNFNMVPSQQIVSVIPILKSLKIASQPLTMFIAANGMKIFIRHWVLVLIIELN